MAFGLGNMIPSLKPVSDWVDPRRNALMGLSAGFLQGDPGAAMRYAMAGAATDRQYAADAAAQAQAEQERNATAEWLKANYPQFANLPPAQGFDAAMKMMAQAQSGGNQETFFGNVVPMQDASGNVVLGQVSNQGNWQPLAGADGMSPAPTTKTIDTGTEIITTDIYGNEIRRTPKQNFQQAYDTASGGAAGKAETEQRLAAPGDVAAGQNALTLVDNIRNDPALNTATGLFGVVLNKVPGFDQLGFARKVEQLKSGAFLSAIEQLRGMGALSNAEGQTATAAITRLSTDLSAADFKEALNEYETIVSQGIARAQSKMGQKPAGGPVVGAVEDGYQYMGGDPSNPNSWKKM